MWIKLSDRKPLYGDYSVLAAHENGNVEMCHVDDLRWSVSGYTHWMDLPAPPNSDNAESETHPPTAKVQQKGTVMQYRKKPVVVDALQCKEPNTIADIMAFCPCAQPSDGGDNGLQWVWIETLEGTMAASYGDYVIKGVKGEVYPCKPDIFKATYEPVPQEIVEQNQTADNIPSASCAK